jgi:hypothetical protein
VTDVTLILSPIEAGDSTAIEHLLPLVYGELKRLAAQRLAHEKPGQTLQATALVHEAFLRLLDGEEAKHWNCLAVRSRESHSGSDPGFVVETSLVATIEKVTARRFR